MYIGDVINLGTHFMELDRKIFGQFIMVDHTQHHL
jgi:hypothetical protein